MMYGFRDSFTYFQCASCQCLQIATIPADMAKYYPADYNGFAAPKEGYFQGLKGAFRKMRYAAALFQEGMVHKAIAALFPADQYQLLGSLPLRRDSRILDVGCGAGSYLFPLYELGMKQVQGVDPFIASPLVYPNGYRVTKSFIHQMTGTWDVVIYNHSFEHVPDPLENLQAVERLLHPEGTCIIRIPTVSSYAWEHYRTNWFQLDAPRHFYLHSIQSMDLLARQAGLKLVEVVYDSKPMQFIGSENYAAGIAMREARGKAPFFRRKMEKWKYGSQAKELNKAKRGDQAAFFLQKKH
jgi:SAM-dependent methyltransferase